MHQIVELILAVFELKHYYDYDYDYYYYSDLLSKIEVFLRVVLAPAQHQTFKLKEILEQVLMISNH